MTSRELDTGSSLVQLVLLLLPEVLMAHRYLIVDAFSAHPLLGNPVAVVLDAEGLDTEQMLAIARWTNLSETTFVLPATVPNADYRLRIFTPVSELAFAGHPTLGSAKAVVHSGRLSPRDGLIVQECKAGLIDVRLQGEGAGQRFTLQLPEARIDILPADQWRDLEQVFGFTLDDNTPLAAVDVGIVWGVAEVDSVETLMALQPDQNGCAAFERRNGLTGITLYARSSDGNIEARSFAAADGIPEDPVCGSGNGAVAAYRRHIGQLPGTDWSYLSRQGRCVHRDGYVHLSCDGQGVLRVGGQCVVTAEGILALN